MIDWAERLITFLYGHDYSLASYISFYLFAFAIPLLYAILSIKKFMGIRWNWAIPAGIAVMIAVSMSNLLYRLIILILTLWIT